MFLELGPERDGPMPAKSSTDFPLTCGSCPPSSERSCGTAVLETTRNLGRWLTELSRVDVEYCQH